MKPYKYKDFDYKDRTYTISVYKKLDKRVKEGTWVQLEQYDGIWFQLSEVNRNENFIVLKEDTDRSFDITDIAKFSNRGL